MWARCAVGPRPRSYSLQSLSVERADRLADELVEDADAFFPLRAEVSGVVVARVEVALDVFAHAGVFVGDLFTELDDRFDIVLGVVGEEVLEDEVGVSVATR